MFSIIKRVVLKLMHKLSDLYHGTITYHEFLRATLGRISVFKKFFTDEYSILDNENVTVLSASTTQNFISISTDRGGIILHIC